MIKQATGIYSLPQLLHQLWCLGKSAQLRSDWEFGLLHLVRLRYTLSKVIYLKYYKRCSNESCCFVVDWVVREVMQTSVKFPTFEHGTVYTIVFKQKISLNKSEKTVNLGFEG